MASTPILLQFMNLTDTEIRKIALPEVLELKKTCDDLHCRELIAFSACINNSIAFFQTAAITFEKMVAKFHIHADYQKAKETYEGQLNMAHTFLIHAQKKLLSVSKI